MAKYNPVNAYEQMCNELLPMIGSWSDLYTWLESKVDDVRESGGDPIRVYNALFHMFAFMVAMRDLPEEGDAKIIAQEVIKIITMESKSRLGFDLHSADSDEVADIVRESVTTAIKQLVEERAKAELVEEAVPVVVDGKIRLH